MKRETLVELGLDTDQVKAVMAEHGKSVTSLRKEVSARQDELEELKQAHNTLQQDLENKYASEQKDFAIRHTMKNTDAFDNDIVIGLLDKDQIQIKDNELVGLNEQLMSLKEDKPFLFKPEEEAPEAKPMPQIVVGGNPVGQSSVVEKDAFSSVSDKYR